MDILKLSLSLYDNHDVSVRLNSSEFALAINIIVGIAVRTIYLVVVSLNHCHCDYHVLEDEVDLILISY